ncbi:MAG: DUF2059 domain-containing protein [Devosiaceae bacterium]|nr:DUF2059 domain-containing protein [Devosiaceae bacterium MH13]
MLDQLGLRRQLVAGFAAFSLALLSPLAGVAPAVAQDQAAPSESHLQLGSRFAELVGANNLYVAALNAQRRDLIRQLASTNPDITDLIREVTDAAYLEMADSTGSLFEQIAIVYANAYSEAELVDLIAFFETPVGVKFLEVRQAADQAAVQATLAWGDAINAAFLARVRALLAERGVQL